MNSNDQKMLRIGVNSREPYISFRHGQWSGLFMTALDVICRKLKFRCVIQNVPLTGLVDKELDGVLGAVLSKKVDMGVAALGMTQARASHFQMVYSFYDRKYSVLIHQNKLVTSDGTGGISPLTILAADVWVIAIGILVVISCIISIGEGRCSLKRVSNIAFRLLASTLNQMDIESATLSLGASVCLLVLTWLFWSLIIIAVFSTSLPAVFSVAAAKQLPFSDLKSLAESDFELDGTLQSQLLFNDSASPDARLLASKMVVQDPKANWLETIDRMAGDRRLASVVGHEVFNEIGNYTRWMTSFACLSNVIALEGAAKPPIAAFVFTPDSPLRDSFQREYIRLLEFGLIDIMYQQGLRGVNGEFHGSERCAPHTHDIQRQIHFGTVKLIHMQFAILIFLCGLGVASLCVMIEVARQELRRHNFSSRYRKYRVN
ncbi:hypothetical protein BV898_11620 [Hypsibius exemplaris]|uniref:Ionotropic glutamate receptor L-glutamate and glycine-binding domain-containing protein n=1 Tax=Hypsibius exemplaris TaxID=2072580 RepID=A0A1W0WG23_HYPEX|nr:hypothetical protein BV898_11620 [Hypsibius exemplaris]